MTNQETFDIVARHLVKQGCRSYEYGFGCVYRSSDGKKCAVGALIPDELYSKEMEGKTAVHEIVAPVLTKLGHDPDFCNALQMVHDGTCSNNFIPALKEVATSWRLTVPEDVLQ